jgi:hypothetical protein
MFDIRKCARVGSVVLMVLSAAVLSSCDDGPSYGGPSPTTDRAAFLEGIYLTETSWLDVNSGRVSLSSGWSQILRGGDGSRKSLSFDGDDVPGVELSFSWTYEGTVLRMDDDLGSIWQGNVPSGATTFQMAGANSNGDLSWITTYTRCGTVGCAELEDTFTLGDG